jgi:hypothetical protein
VCVRDEDVLITGTSVVSNMSSISPTCVYVFGRIISEIRFLIHKFLRFVGFEKNGVVVCVHFSNGKSEFIISLSVRSFIAFTPFSVIRSRSNRRPVHIFLLAVCGNRMKKMMFILKGFCPLSTKIKNNSIKNRHVVQ